MPFYFENFPKVSYDIDKTGNTIDATNLFVRYKIVDAFKKGEKRKDNADGGLNYLMGL